MRGSGVGGRSLCEPYEHHDIGRVRLGCSCNFEFAIEGAANNDNVYVQTDCARTPYSVTSDVVVGSSSVTIQGVGRPVINSTSPTVQPLKINASSVTVKDLRFQAATNNVGGPYGAVSLGNLTVADGIEVYSSGTGAAVLMSSTHNSMLRNSVVYTSNSNVTVMGDGKVINDTIINDAPSGANPIALLLNNNFNGAAVLRVRNTIMRSLNGPDFYLENGGGGSSAVSFDVDYSNFDQAEYGANNPGAVVQTFGTNNQAGLPQLTQIAGATDIHQMSGSSATRNVGIVDTDMGTTDFEGQARNGEGTPDIGADEFGSVPALGNTCPPPPVVDILKPVISKLKAVKKKGKLKSFTFSSTEAGTAIFKYTKKKGSKYKSAGSQTKTVKAGKNSVKPKKLKKGLYKLTLTVKDAAGNVSSSKKLSFKTK